MSESRRITGANGGGLSCLVSGCDDGPAVIFHHGTPGTGGQQPSILSQLESSYRLITPERPGYGDTPECAFQSLEALAIDLLATLDALDVDEATIIGYSGGTPSALACAALAPERCRHVLLISPLAPLSAPGVTHGMLPLVSKILRLAHTDPASFAAEILTPGARLEPLLAAAMAQMPATDRELAASAAITDAAGFLSPGRSDEGLRGLVDDYARLANYDRLDLKAVRCAVGIWHGTADVNTPPVMAEYLDAALPVSRRLPEPSAGHLLAFDPRRAVPPALCEAAGLTVPP